VSTSAAPSPTSCLLGSDGAIHTQKIASSVDDYARAIVEGLGQVLRETGIAPAALDEIRHGTTVAFQRHPRAQGAKVGLVTTKVSATCWRSALCACPASTTSPGRNRPRWWSAI